MAPDAPAVPVSGVAVVPAVRPGAQVPSPAARSLLPSAGGASGLAPEGVVLRGDQRQPG